MDAFGTQNTVLVIALVLTLLLGIYFSAAEMAFSSLNRLRIKTMAEAPSEKQKRAQRVEKLYEEEFDAVIATLLIWNNTVAIASATLSAALFVRFLGQWGYAVSTVFISAIVIVFTDIFPKSLSRENPEKVAMWCVPLLCVLMVMLKPVNRLILKVKPSTKASKELATEQLGPEEQSFREQELILMTREAEKDGAIAEEDTTLITNAISFHDIPVLEVLTPRVDVVSVSHQASVQEVEALFLETEYSRLVVHEGSLDQIKGVIHLRDFLRLLALKDTQAPLSLPAIIKPATFTIASAKIGDVLQLFKACHTHLAIVSDEHGGTEGIVTMDDVLTCLVGDILDEHDEIVEPFLQLEKGKYRLLGTVPIGDVFAFFGLQEESASSTVGGWIMEKLRRIPQNGDAFACGGLKVTVIEANARRVVTCQIEITVE